MAFYKLDELSACQVNPGFLAKFVHSERMSIGFWEIAAGSRFAGTFTHARASLLFDRWPFRIHHR